MTDFMIVLLDVWTFRLFMTAVIDILDFWIFRLFYYYRDAFFQLILNKYFEKINFIRKKKV